MSINNELFFRMPGFIYPCTCEYGCLEDEAFCNMTKATRNSCKRCRYNKCLSAGMVKGWVLSAHVLRNKKEATPKESKLETPEFIQTITNKYNLASIVDDEVS